MKASLFSSPNSPEPSRKTAVASPNQLRNSISALMSSARLSSTAKKSFRPQTSTKPRPSKSPTIQTKSPFDHSRHTFTSVSKVASISQIFKPIRAKNNTATSNSVGNMKPLKRIICKKKVMSSIKKANASSPRKNDKAQYEASLREPSAIKERKSRIKGEFEKVRRKIINSSNGIETFGGSFINYSVYIGKGNNHPMVKRLFTGRSWWKIVENKDNSNFIWSQWKDKQIISELKCGKTSFRDPKTKLLTDCNKLDLTGMELIQNSSSYTQLDLEKIFPEQQRLHNRLEFNNHLTNKKGLLNTMKNYYQACGKAVFDKLPLTFNVSSLSDQEYGEFLQAYEFFETSKSDSSKNQNLWIVKPGEFSNRGNGIKVCKSLEEIASLLKPLEDKSYIIQKYLENPMLINKRKFDIRCYAMITSINSVIQGYFYLDGYLRTTSQEFTLEEVTNPFVHLTNDAIQKHSSDYGKFENGNKLSYRDFQKYLDKNYPEKKLSFALNILPTIKETIKDTILASFLKIDKNRRQHCMEIFGYDFMIDSNFKPWLIEVNTNPCLETSSPILRAIIPAMLENAFRLTIDCLFPPPIRHHSDLNILNRFELIFHEEVDGRRLLQNIGKNKELLED